MGFDIGTASEGQRELYKSALLAREHAHCPYSGYKVGAAIRLSSGEVFSGCNVENASYGASICAERVAIQKAVSEKGKIFITEIMVVTDTNPPWPPCGLCRQVISEFASKEFSTSHSAANYGEQMEADFPRGVSDNITVYACNLDGQYNQYSFREILPHAFTPDALKAAQNTS